MQKVSGDGGAGGDASSAAFENLPGRAGAGAARRAVWETVRVDGGQDAFSLVRIDRRGGKDVPRECIHGGGMPVFSGKSEGRRGPRAHAGGDRRVFGMDGTRNCDDAAGADHSGGAAGDRTFLESGATGGNHWEEMAGHGVWAYVRGDSSAASVRRVDVVQDGAGEDAAAESAGVDWAAFGVETNVRGAGEMKGRTGGASGTRTACKPMKKRF